MYTYTVTIAYAGSNAFVLFLWARITRGSGSWRFSFQSDPATVATLRTAGTAAQFTFSNIERVPIQPAPEVVP